MITNVNRPTVMICDISSSFCLFVIFSSPYFSNDVLSISRIILRVAGRMLIFGSTKKTTLRWSSQHLMSVGCTSTSAGDPQATSLLIKNNVQRRGGVVGVVKTDNAEPDWTVTAFNGDWDAPVAQIVVFNSAPGRLSRAKFEQVV